MAERPDDPFEMRGKRPLEDTEGGYQDTSIDDAERDFGIDSRVGSSVSREVKEDYDLDTTVFSDQGGNFYM